MAKSSPKPRGWQFSIKALLIVMLLAAGYFAVYGTAMRRAKIAEQRARVEAERARATAEEARMQAEVAIAAMAKARFQAVRAQQLTESQQTRD